MDTGNKSAHIGPNVGPNHINLHGGRHLGTVDQLLNDAGSVVGDKDKEGQAELIGYNFNNYFSGVVDNDGEDVAAKMGFSAGRHTHGKIDQPDKHEASQLFGPNQGKLCEAADDLQEDDAGHDDDQGTAYQIFQFRQPEIHLIKHTNDWFHDIPPFRRFNLTGGPAPF